MSNDCMSFMTSDMKRYKNQRTFLYLMVIFTSKPGVKFVNVSSEENF